MPEQIVLQATESELPASVAEMAARHLGAHREHVVITTLAGDASTRRYFRMRHGQGYDFQAAGDSQACDETVIVSLYPAPFDETEPARNRLARLTGSDPSARLIFANDPCAHIEVTALFLKAGLPVPRVVSVWGMEGALLFEDVGDARLQDWVASRPAGEYCPAYRHALDLVVRIQEGTRRCGPDSICSALAFDEGKLKWELDFFFRHYFGHHLQANLDSETIDRIEEDFAAICRELAAMPRVLVHRDYHARNLMMRNGTMYIIDHQDARMGPESYDVVSLLRDPYTGLKDSMIEELAEYFVEAKAASAVPLIDPKNWPAAFHLMTIQRTLKAAGTYAYQSAVINNPVYRPYLEPAISSAVSSMRSLGRFKHLRSALENGAN
jgi:hypothetical protein